MILNFDAAQLEWRAVAHLSRDKVAIQEIKDGLDFHTDNQIKFKLPSRLIAKKFLFRAIYKGSAYAYSVDNDFKHIGGQKFWQKVIDGFYDKYEGIHSYHASLIRTAMSEGRLVSETGRTYYFEPSIRRGELKWPINDIVNYPVQGFSADLMSLARVSFYNRLVRKYDDLSLIKQVNSVHDSIVLDVGISMKETIELCRMMKEVFQDIPDNFRKIYGKEVYVPMDCDAKVGVNWLWLHNLKISIDKK